MLKQDFSQLGMSVSYFECVHFRAWVGASWPSMPESSDGTLRTPSVPLLLTWFHLSFFMPAGASLPSLTYFLPSLLSACLSGSSSCRWLYCLIACGYITALMAILISSDHVMHYDHCHQQVWLFLTIRACKPAAVVPKILQFDNNDGPNLKLDPSYNDKPLIIM